MLENMPQGSGVFGILQAGLEGFTDPQSLSEASEYIGKRARQELQSVIENRDVKAEDDYEENYNNISGDNLLSGAERIQAMKRGETLNLEVAENPYAQYNMPNYTIDSLGKYYVDKYGDIIEKYAQKYNVDADMVKAIMYNEASTGHKLIFNWLGDLTHTSDSQMPMNIQGDTWGNFQGTYYDTNDSEQNIELAVRVIKQITDSLRNPTPENIGTIWNGTGKNVNNSYGLRTKTIYDEKPWLEGDNK